MEAVRVLAGEIGGRPPCSPEEQRAARWCAERLSKGGLHVEIESFESAPSVHTRIACYFVAAAIAALAAAPAPLVGAVIGAAALVLYARDAEGRPLLTLGGGRSVNVLARLNSDTPPQLVVVSQIDSPRAILTASPHFGPGRRGWTIVVHGALVLAPVICSAAWVVEAGRPLPTGLWAVSAVVAAPLLAGAALEMHSERALGATNGANDCASGVEVVMRLARRFRDERVWWLLVGSGSTANAGMQSFLTSHAHELGDARILNILPVGAGTISAAADEGMLRLRRADGALIDAAVEAGAESGAYRVTQSAAAVAMVHHRRALSLVGLDERGAAPNQAWTDDVVDRVDSDAVDSAEGIAARVVEVTTGALDRGPLHRGSGGSIGETPSA